MFGLQHAVLEDEQGTQVGLGGGGAGLGPVGHSQAVPPPQDWHATEPGQYCTGETVGLQQAALDEVQGDQVPGGGLGGGDGVGAGGGEGPAPPGQ